MEAILLGASGLIGRELLTLLLNDPTFSMVTIIVRKKLPIENEKLRQIIADFSTIETCKNYLKGDVIFSCLGSTKKKTPNRDIYYQIDHDYPLHVAKTARSQGIKDFHLVSSLGANRHSSNFYLRMKGEIEEDLAQLNFKSLHIYRPSLLKGERKEKRTLEKLSITIMDLIDPLLFGSLKKYQSIAAKTVALAMHRESLKKQTGKFIYPSDKIKEIV